MHDNSPEQISVIDRARLSAEQKIIYDVIGRFGLEPLLKRFEEEELQSCRDAVLGTCLKLSSSISPKLFALLEEVRTKLEYNEPVDLFVEADANINAHAIHSCDDSPNIVVLTSRLIERMEDVELKFVIGHEIGHLHYRHYRARQIDAAIGDKDKMPKLLRYKLRDWHRLAEFSADRAGFIAADRDLKSTVSTFFKLASGLGPEHLQFDIAAFLDQLTELEQLSNRTLLCGFSHPITPIRVRALQMFKDVIEAADATAWDQMDEEVLNLAKLMDYQPSEPIEIHGRDFLLAAGLLIGHADGEGISEEEQSMLVDMLLPLMADPEEKIARITTTDQAKQLMVSSARWLKENAGEERFEIIRMLARVAAVDGKLHAEEEETLKDAAELLAVPWRAAKNDVHEVLGHFLQAQQTAQMPPRARLQ